MQRRDPRRPRQQRRRQPAPARAQIDSDAPEPRRQRRGKQRRARIHPVGRKDPGPRDEAPPLGISDFARSARQSSKAAPPGEGTRRSCHAPSRSGRTPPPAPSAPADAPRSRRSSARPGSPAPRSPRGLGDQVARLDPRARQADQHRRRRADLARALVALRRERRVIGRVRRHHAHPLARQGRQILTGARMQDGDRALAGSASPASSARSGAGRAVPVLAGGRTWADAGRALLLFQRALQRMLVAAGEIHHLRHLGLGHLEGKHADHRDARLCTVSMMSKAWAWLMPKNRSSTCTTNSIGV
jgi:hypothetical protein